MTAQQRVLHCGAVEREDIAKTAKLSMHDRFAMHAGASNKDPKKGAALQGFKESKVYSQQHPSVLHDTALNKPGSWRSAAMQFRGSGSCAGSLKSD